ncbi:hypothetical protein MLD38_011750 [Melastoma candidum]|uniref:Uncharacterized protein n=1 Tax=Melastoma candidum TaxID=119954 RepID=A0ACB9R434_9MYRT|nr:hypothetical protein MLD38_011750 [Melastoma candidum]
MNFGFSDDFPWFKAYLNKDVGLSFGSTTMVVDQPAQRTNFDFRFLGWSILSILPLTIRSQEKTRVPPAIDGKFMRHVHSDEKTVAVRTNRRFRPYVSKVPWHTGARAFLSQLFPRYGHYCGPNWSSGKAGGSLVWDQRPIDWLDFCCYCHDMGYDTHDQAKLLEADLEFLRCLETQNSVVKGDAHVAHLYKTMCVTGLKHLLIPYRMNLVKLRSSGQPIIDFGWASNLRWESFTFKKS